VQPLEKEWERTGEGTAEPVRKGVGRNRAFKGGEEIVHPKEPERGGQRKERKLSEAIRKEKE